MSQPKAGAQPSSHGDKKASEASSTLGEKKAEVEEKSPATANVTQPTKTQTSGTPAAVKQQPPSADASEPQLKKPSDTKPTPTSKPEPGKNALSTKPNDSQNKQPSEERQKEPSGAQSSTSPSMKTTSKPNSRGKATTAPTDQPSQAASVDMAKAKSEKMSTAAGAGTASTSVVATPEGSNDEPGMDESALDSLIDTLGGSEDVPTGPVYTGPEVKEDVSSRYLEELGKRESSLPPEYVKLLKSKGDGKNRVPPKAGGQDEKPMTEDELAEALSSGFTCSTAPDEGRTRQTKTASKKGKMVQAQAASTVKASVPPKGKKGKSKEEIKDEAMEALLDTLGGPEPEPEEDLTPVVEVSEAKVKEKKEEKTGERDDTIPPEYRFTTELSPLLFNESTVIENTSFQRREGNKDKDEKPVLPKPEEKSKPSTKSDEPSKDSSAQLAVKSKQSKSRRTPKVPSAPVTAKPTEDKVVPSATACIVQSSAPSAAVGGVPDEALEALSISLGKREHDPKENKPTVDKVKEKNNREKQRKLGEDEETIPPDYRSREAKDKDGKALLPKPEEKPQPMSENDLIQGLAEGFSCSYSSTPLPTAKVGKKTKKGKKATGSSDVISAATASSVQSAAPSTSTSGKKKMDKALDLLSDSLGQREPDPDEDKPVVDKVKKKVRYDLRDKLGERDDTLPPEHLKRLESGEQDPTDDSAASDALSGDISKCAQAPATQQDSKDKSTKETNIKTAQEDEGRPTDPQAAMGRSPSSKPEEQETM